MNTVLPLRKALLVSATILLGFTFTSWKQSTIDTPRSIQDTTPSKKEKKTVDLDQALDELDNAKADVEKSMQNIDWDKMNADMKEAMKNLDVNMKDMQENLKKSLSEIDVEKMKHDVNEAVAKIDWDEIKRNMDKAKDIDLDKVRAEVETAKAAIEKEKPAIEKSMRDAHESIEKAKVEMRAYQAFIEGLEKDGRINSKEGYTIENKNGQLIINGKQQPASVYNKYRTFLEKNKKLTIKKDKDGLHINNE